MNASKASTGRFIDNWDDFRNLQLTYLIYPSHFDVGMFIFVILVFTQDWLQYMLTVLQCIDSKNNT